MPSAPQLRTLPNVRQYSTSFRDYGLKEFLNIEEVVDPEAIKLFYANMSIVDRDEPVIQSLILGTQIEFNVKHLCQILNLPMRPLYLTAYEDLPACGRTNEEVHSIITNTVLKPKTAT